MLTSQQIIEAIVAGDLFFARLGDGTYIARYTRHGQVLRVTSHGLAALPVQGSDLCWFIQTMDEPSSH